VLRRNEVKIIIMKCTKEGAWWNEAVGETLEVVKELEEDYLIKVKDKKMEGNHILKSDCVIIER
jgi:SOS-response transcriptional repressor LexA